MIMWEKGRIREILSENQTKQIVIIENEKGEGRKGINYPLLTGVCISDDEVLYNRTAVELKLGTGGYDFIIANLTHPPTEGKLPNGHTMKNRYTPLQLAFQSGEEHVDLLSWESIERESNLRGIPVLIISLHSMLPLLTILLKEKNPDMKIVYLMTDSTSLPIWLSEHVQHLKERNLLHATITSGQAFGGDLESINTYSGLLLAKYRLGADLIIMGGGPGSMGTGTVWGYSAIEIGELVNTVNILAGLPIIPPRISFLDPRPRHYGFSHHILTALSKVALTPAHLALPHLDDHRFTYLLEQIEGEEIMTKHYLHLLPAISGESIFEIMKNYGVNVTTMGRGIADDPVYFQGVAAAAELALTYLEGEEEM